MTTAPSTVPAPSRVRTYASFVRFEHTLFSLPLILAGVFSTPGPAMTPMRWLWVAIAAVGARTAGMSLNRLIDRRIDALNPRTKVRELPAGKMKTPEAVALLVGSTAAYLIACAILGPWFLKVAVLPLAVFTLYPYLKRFTPFCHFGVGVALALAPLAGYAAAHPSLEHAETAWWLGAFALAWVSGFDVIYATLDEDFDRSHGIHSMVAWLGRTNALRVSWLLHLASRRRAGAGGARGRCCMRRSPWWRPAGDRCSTRSAVPAVARTTLGGGREPRVLPDQRVGRRGGARHRARRAHGRGRLLMSRYLIGMTGASGAIHGVDFVKRCPGEKYLVMSDWARQVLLTEHGLKSSDLEPHVKKIFRDDDLAAPFASGSNRYDAFVILPCSVSTLGKIAAGISDTLITRAAAVALKERMRLVVGVRETPLSSIALENCLKLSREGVVIMPVSPPWYGSPKDLDALVGGFTDKLLTLLGEKGAGPAWRQDELE
ncbi:MAG: UbiX family flavin prenyltransferase [Candidatus Eisenbacteria bacterium]|nr:UbiX family flavin prenyltransferase [Candidatus Eisenbacteria bacterium]